MKRILSVCVAAAMMLGMLAFDMSAQPPAVITAAAAPSKLIAFTFDDGPGFYTDDLLDGLAERGAKATFFVNGENGPSLGAAFHTNLLRRMANEGHQLANHTYSHHVPFDGLSASSMISQVDSVNTYLYNAMGGTYQTLVRTPGGANSQTIRNTISSPIILWSIDTLDWKYRNSNTIYNHIVNKAYDGAIVLLHDIYSTSVNGALQAISTLQSRGYECVTVSELFRRRGITLQNGTVYTHAGNTATTLPAYSAPVINDTLDTVSGKAKITLSASQKGQALYYTTDGSTPTLADTKYTRPFTVPYGITIRVAGFDTFGTRTPVARKTLDQSYEGVFDASYYAERYPDLKKAFGTNASKLLNHFRTFGINEGRCGAVTFNVKYYMENYPEPTFDNDPTRYMLHFLTKGMAAGYRGSEEFDPVSYRLYYPDLRKAYGNNWKLYYTHYLRHGQKEGRIPTGCTTMRHPTTVYNGVDYAAVYDFEYYINRYNDIRKVYGFNDAAALRHFVVNGMKEGRDGCDTFHVRVYQSRYKDLQRAFGDNLKAYFTHYLKNGIKEGRTGQ